MRQGVPVVLYWMTGLAVGLFYMKEELKSFGEQLNFRKEINWQRVGILALGLLIVVANAFVYRQSTTDGGRPLDALTLVIFTVANGLCETFLFLAVFKFGEYLVQQYSQNRLLIYASGLMLFFVYAGGIHGAFWIQVLPQHMVDSKIALGSLEIPRQFVFFPLQVMLTISWSVIYFLYRDFWSVAALHALVDATMVYCIHYSLFVPTVLEVAKM